LRLAGREELLPEQQYQRYYTDSGLPEEVVCRALRDVARAAGVPVGLLRPTDRFDTELAPEKDELFDSDWSVFSWWVGRKLKRQGTTVQDLGVESLHDFVLRVAPLVYEPHVNREPQRR
jgi:hypothetical protein